MENMRMNNFKITLEYDGRDFAGWQRQSETAGRTVQGVLEEALSRICAHRVMVHGSGRTDAGVHARGQVASFVTESARTAAQIVQGANCLLPPDVAIIAAEAAPLDFHARFSAASKVYDYDFSISPVRKPLLNKRAWWVGPGLDWAEIEKALPHLLGEHDFAAFQSTGSETKSSVRTIYRAEMSEPGQGLKRLTLEGSGFLRHMVRAIAGILAEIGRGRRPAAALPEIIARADRSLSGPTAPPDGLYLARVIYEAEGLSNSKPIESFHAPQGNRLKAQR
ncbi:tRNA pseudouridine(38-40) synthase TruA [Deltaproteobacteria bacterium Smac51]|nr:tRNA pseudouridine(38-40) synthase TruA [Deltaproteobacteria bacterium Smac51]